MAVLKRAAAVVALLVLQAPVAALSAPQNGMAECRQCHGSVPGVDGEKKSFNPGAHELHKAIACETCHGDATGPAHIDGVIMVAPEVGYSLGTEIPWPAFGAGRCGGFDAGGKMSGCHADPGVRCDWVPLGKCRKMPKR